MTNNFAYNIRYLRKLNHLNQTQLAQIVGKSKKTVSAWENNSRTPLVEDVYVLAKYFNLDMETLYFGEVYADLQG